MIKANYSKIASFYDKGRFLSEKNTVMWLRLISELSGAQKGCRVLDLGCGTGRFSLPMARRLGLSVTGADLSSEMLDKAKQKDSDFIVNWVLADAGSMTFPPNSFDVVFMSHLLHHIDSPLKAIRECLRILSPSGVVLIRYGAMNQISSDVEHTFFPEVTGIDEARTPSVVLTEGWLADAGFKDISSREITQQTYRNGMAHLEAARAKSTSVLSMISEESFQIGLRRLEEHVKKNPDDDWVLFDKMTMTVGCRDIMPSHTEGHTVPD